MLYVLQRTGRNDAVLVKSCRQSKDANSKFAWEKDAKGNPQPTTYVYEQDWLIPKLCMTRTNNLSNTQFGYQIVFFIHIYGYVLLCIYLTLNLVLPSGCQNFHRGASFYHRGASFYHRGAKCSSILWTLCEVSSFPRVCLRTNVDQYYWLVYYCQSI